MALFIVMKFLCSFRHTGLSSAILKRRAVPERVPRVKCASSFVELSRLAFPILLQLGPHVGADPTLVIKLIRLGRIFMVKVNKVPTSSLQICLLFVVFHISYYSWICFLIWISCNMWLYELCSSMMNVGLIMQVRLVDWNVDAVLSVCWSTLGNWPHL